MISNQIKKFENQLASAAGTVQEIDALNNLAGELVIENTERSEKLAQRALELARQCNSPGCPYGKGEAVSLSILGRIASRRCDYLSALSQLQAAQVLLEAVKNQEELTLALRELGWVYFNLGDFPLAIQLLYKSLSNARELGDTNFEARVLNTLGAVYGENGNQQESIDILHKALKYLDTSDDQRLRCLIYNNLAMTQFEMQAYDDALASASHSLAIAQQLNSPDLLASSLDTTGQIYLAKKDYYAAEGYFVQAQSFYQGEGNDPDEITLNLAKAAAGQGCTDDAVRWLRQSLESADARGGKRVKYKIHELLSSIYESQGDFQNAVEHFKRFHEIKSLVYNEETQLKLSNLMVLQQAETTQIEAEIYRLKNLSLRKEISNQRQVVAEMEILATTDALTGLLNRRHLMTLGTYSFEVARQEGQPISVLMMDIDDFKRVNDMFGHITGDKVLRDISASIQTGLRKWDLLGRYGGEEFVAILPKTNVTTAQKVADRIVRKVAAHVTHAGAHTIQVTVSIGIAQAKITDKNLDKLLERADQALYTAKRSGKNRSVKSNDI